MSVEITFGTYSDNLVQNFNAWLNANAVNVNATYQRVTAEYKTKVIKDKKTNQLVKQEKKKPNSTAVDPLSGKDQWSSALYMVNRLKNRFSDELHVAATIFIDYLVQQFSRVAIVNCRTVDKKARIYVKHILDNANQIELLPLVSHFKCYKTALKTHTLNMKNKANGTTENDVEDEKEKIKVKKHHFSYCVFGVCKQVIDDLNRENPNAGYDKILISSEYKAFMCELVDELVQSFGPILRQEIVSHDVKTVNVGTFYRVLSVLLNWHHIDFTNIKSYISDRIKRYDNYTTVRAEERKSDRSNGINPNSDESSEQ